MLEKYPAFESADPEVVRASLEGLVGLTHFDILSENDFKFRANKFRLDNLSLAWYFDGSGTRCDFAEENVVKQLICIAGNYSFKLDNKRLTANRVRWSALIPQNTGHSLSSDPCSELLSLRIQSSAINRKLEAICGEVPGAEIQFDPDISLDYNALETLRRATLYFVNELSSDHTDYLSVAMEEFQELLIVNFLFAHKHNFSAKLLRTRISAPSHSHLQRVEDYIAANFAKSISIEELSLITGTSVRSLFRYFKKWRGISPLDFVKQVRLEASRQMLASPEHGTSVMSVAYKCGFQSHGHFAREYKSKFGELPSETLSRCLRKR